MTFERLHFEKGRSGFITRFKPNWEGERPRLHRHRELELNVVGGGTGIYYIGGDQYSIGPGNMVWLFSGQPHVLADTSLDFQMWVIVFRTSFVRRMSQPDWTQVLRKRDPGEVYVRSLNRDIYGRLDGLCERLSETAADDNPYFNACLACLLREAWETTRSSNPLAVSGKVHPAVERAVQSLTVGTLDKPFEDLARESGISYSRLGHLFREQMGETLGDYRNRLRIQRFQFLASNHPERTLLDCVLEAGFGSYSQAHRVIRDFTGKAPKEFRDRSFGRRD